MTTPSGQISAQDIKNEFGETGEGKVALGSYRVSQTCGELTLPIGDGIPTSGQISYSNMRGKRLNIVVDYYSGGTISRQDNGDATMNAKSRYDNENDKVKVIGGLRSKPSSTEGKRVRIHVNKTLGGKKGNKNFCALRTGTGWHSNTALVVDVGGEGKIFGAGGDGGEGGNDLDAGNAGGDGSSALGIDVDASINVASGGLIRCGFGGGGGGGSGRQVDKGSDRRAGGGGGGGGQGFPGGSGGDRGRAGPDNAGDGSAGDLSEAGEGGGGGNNAGETGGGTGGEGGSQGEAANSGNGSSFGGGAGGAEGAAIRRASNSLITPLENDGTITGDMNGVGVS